MESGNILEQTGWILFDSDPTVLNWVEHTLPAARQALHDPTHRHWWRYQDTWFVGVNVLDNDGCGAITGGPPLSGRAMSYIDSDLAWHEIPLDKAQVSVCFPGYPHRSADESEFNHQYRYRRDAAHIDGLLRRGPERRRYLGEYHAFILGIPMVPFPAQASPFVVWEGSHRIAQKFFQNLLEDRDPATWQDLDLTEPYRKLRQSIFRQCSRKEIHAIPGQCYLVHRMALHGMAPWQTDTPTSSDGRMICYFRPEVPNHLDWLMEP